MLQVRLWCYRETFSRVKSQTRDEQKHTHKNGKFTVKCLRIHKEFPSLLLLFYSVIVFGGCARMFSTSRVITRPHFIHCVVKSIVGSVWLYISYKILLRLCKFAVIHVMSWCLESQGVNEQDFTSPLISSACFIMSSNENKRSSHLNCCVWQIRAESKSKARGPKH